MEEKLIEGAIGVADTIQQLYKKINCFRSFSNHQKEQEAMQSLELAWELEDYLYKQIPLKEIEKYQRMIIKKNFKVYNYDYYDLLFGNINYDPTFRVYMRLIHMEYVEHYYNEFHLESFSSTKAGYYLKNRFSIQSLYYLIQNSQNHYYSTNAIYEEEKYNLAFHFKEIETQFWKNSENANLQFPTEKECAFVSCDKFLIHDAIDLSASDFLYRYFVDLYGGTFDYPNQDDLLLAKPLHELYLRFLFFLMEDKRLKQTSMDVLQQNLSAFPEFHDVLQNSIWAIQEDSKKRELFRKA